MFPVRDENPRLRFPVVTFLLIVCCVTAWIALQGLGTAPGLPRSLCLFGLIPADLLGTVRPGSLIPLGDNLVCVLDGQGRWITPLSSMFMHGGWFHLIGNLWFLWIFGDNVEDAMGRVRFLIFYLLCGLSAAAAQVAADIQSSVPMVGASGAIGGVMGAYALLFPRVRVEILLVLGFWVTTIAVPAIYMLGYWFLLQLLGGLPSVVGSARGGVAFWAHIGGFVAGLLLCPVFVNRENLAMLHHRRRQLHSRYRW